MATTVVPIGTASSRPAQARTSRSSATATCASARSRRPRRSPARTASRPRSSTCARSARSTPPPSLASVEQDRQGAGRPRGEPIRRLRRRDRGDDRARRLRAPGRPGHPPGRAGGAWRPVPPQPGGLVHARVRPRSSTRRARWPPTEPMPSATQLLATQMDEAYRFVRERVAGTDRRGVLLGADGRLLDGPAGRGRSLARRTMPNPIPIPRRSPPSPGALVHLAECKVMYHEYAFGPGDG